MNAEFPLVSIVLLGEFRPDNFLPDKLVSGKLISRKLAESVSYVSLLPNHQVQYKFGWGEILVLPGRFQITTNEAPYIRICDFVLKAIGDLAPESSVTAFGINRESNYDLLSVTARNKLGMRLAPPEAWGAWGRKLRDSIEGEHQGTPMQGGVNLLQMRLPFLDGRISGWLDVVVMPSSRIQNNSGVLLRANHHHQIFNSASENEEINEKLSSSDITSELLAGLSNRFDGSINDSESIFQEVITS